MNVDMQSCGSPSSAGVTAGSQVETPGRAVSGHYLQPVSLSEQLQAELTPSPIVPPRHQRSSARDLLSRVHNDVTRPPIGVMAHRLSNISNVVEPAIERSAPHVYEEMPYHKYLPMLEPHIGVSTELLCGSETSGKQNSCQRQVLLPTRRGNPIYQPSNTNNRCRRKAAILERGNAIVILTALLAIAAFSMALLMISGTLYSHDTSSADNTLLENSLEKIRLLKANYSTLLQQLDSVAGIPSSMHEIERRLAQQSEGLQALQADLLIKFHELSAELMTKLSSINNMTGLYRCSYKTYSTGSAKDNANLTTKWVPRTLEENLSTVIAGVACTTKGGDASRLLSRQKSYWPSHQYQCVCSGHRRDKSSFYCIMHVVLCPSDPP